MVLMPALSLAIAQLAGVKSGQDVMDRAKALLSKFDVPGPVRLHTLGEITPGTVSPWRAELVAKNGFSYTLYLSADGSWTSLQRSYAGHGGAKQTNALGMPSERVVQRWMGRVGTKEPIRLDLLTTGADGVGHAWFAILRNGYPFVSHGRYGYEFAFLTPRSEFLSYVARENPPPVDPRPPAIKGQAGALAALKRIWDTEIAPKAKRERNWRVWYERVRPPELGYWVPKGGKTAILVWLFHFWSSRDVGNAIQGGDSGMLIDAITGEPIPTDVVP
jgi:hypothetical protein